MLVRTIKGFAVSLRIGLMSAGFAALLAVILGVLAAIDRRLDFLVGALIDLTMALPHLVLLILISFAFGGGTRGVIVAVVLSHWPGLARLIRAEVKAVLTADYVAIAAKLGRSRLDIALRHVTPHTLPQALVGAVLLLAESMRYLTAGLWWLGLLPGLSLLVMVPTLERVASGLRLIFDPRRSQE